MSTDEEPEFVQDPMFPPGWFPWQTGDRTWHARPPGRPNPLHYVHAEDKEDCADKAWYEQRKRQDREDINQIDSLTRLDLPGAS